ncbi:hypothetical protein UFOVP1064_53 [uncultured Caudovirales phage]|uniref:Uncharacterized protein n=1 Tax=uncultured Caudovirales phage TaxID=2100421 RepID=A0A6J7XA62_9CAUD|nr:hypothetical protein UFOVP659_22 [uncultured Caudovirales phage]CAB4169298.1 hypothetical protein UFOVP885_1 [uncultured Caudovirales phage]CAB4181662.1 hypothetical protein UFOVP1064_53 [uncultured Caudovirales phage]CAB4189691.1 hypothetical protein UFOVP1197_10 [uncultured Caudovirales phage]CAB4195281.1 hypothetical protein UFOVP1294_6 [uncultured Caudovirales phage]
MNYTELSQAIQDYTENTETTFVNNIPTFVRQTEERVYRAVMIPELRKNVLGTLTSGDKYLARPTDFLTVFSLAVIDGDGNYQYLLDKDVNFMREAYPSPSTSGVPKYYAQFDGESVSTAYGNFIVGPTPDASYQVELHYFYDPPSIVDTNTSWLGDNAEATLLYGSLIEAYTFMKGDPDLMAKYAERYQAALMNLGMIDVRGKRDDYRDGQIRTNK